MSRLLPAHLACLATILLWGLTFISTKLCLQSMTPMQILLSRFVIGYLGLWALGPRWLPFCGWSREGLLALAGLCGICLYYMLENIALEHTWASNVGIITSVAPLFTGLFAAIFMPEERPALNFYVGVVMAAVGVACVSLNGSQLHIKPLGDLLALAAAAIWAIYSLLLKKIGLWGHDAILVTRRIFAYGLLWILVCLPWQPVFPLWAHLSVALPHLLFLGMGASALCFVGWSYSVRILGAVKASVYIYLVPLVTVTAAAIVLGERLSPVAVAGMALTIAGLIVSGLSPKRGGQRRCRGRLKI